MLAAVSQSNAVNLQLIDVECPKNKSGTSVICMLCRSPFGAGLQTPCSVIQSINRCFVDNPLDRDARQTTAAGRRLVLRGCELHASRRRNATQRALGGARWLSAEAAPAVAPGRRVEPCITGRVIHVPVLMQDDLCHMQDDLA